MSMPSAGWYPDPSDPSSQRWWDGSAWTEHTAPGAAPPPPAAPPPAPAWGATPPAPQQPIPTYTMEPDRGTKTAAAAIFVVIALLVLVIGGAIALVLVSRDDGSDPGSTPGTTTFVVPTTTPSPAPTEEGGGNDPGMGAAELSSCKVERATIETAIAAAKASSDAGITATPGEFLVDPSQYEYYTWTGTSPADWALQPIGTPPC